jgi:hypothetical protein
VDNCLDRWQPLYMGKVITTKGEVDERENARRVLERIDRQSTFVAEQVNSMAKWLAASLLAVNGAGALATLNAAKATSYWPSIIFVVGVILALLSGAGLQEIYNRLSDKLHDFDVYWTRVMLGAQRNSEDESKLEHAVDSVTRWAAAPPVLGWLSGFAFLVAASLLGLAVSAANSLDTARCEDIQKDILSANPKRTDGIALYSALGCKPFGQERVHFRPLIIPHNNSPSDGRNSARATNSG